MKTWFEVTVRVDAEDIIDFFGSILEDWPVKSESVQEQEMQKFAKVMAQFCIDNHFWLVSPFYLSDRDITLIKNAFKAEIENR
jgi:hypothetical protein